MAVLLCCFFAYTNSLYVVHWYDITNANQGKVYTSDKVDTSIPTWFQPMQTENLNERLDILPPELQKYRTQTQFLVVPAMGMITPIVELDNKAPDYKSAIQWWNFDYNKYLVGWPTIYPWTASVWNPGNTFIFAHSNFWHDKPGDFKTIFRLTYNIEKGDKILYFKKTEWQRKLYTYEVTQSMLVNETDIRVMLPEKGKKELTLSACRPIGTAKQRRINRASLVSESPINYEIKQQANQVGVLPALNQPEQAETKTPTPPEKTAITMEYNPSIANTLGVKQATKLALELAKFLS